MLHQMFIDFIGLLSAMLLHQLHHGFVIIAPTELNDLLSPLEECRPDDVTLTSI